jgi:hypothetical protein
VPTHEFASLWENRTVRRLNMQPYAYNRRLRPFIKHDEVEPISVPGRGTYLSAKGNVVMASCETCPYYSAPDSMGPVLTNQTAVR